MAFPNREMPQAVEKPEIKRGAIAPQKGFIALPRWGWGYTGTGRRNDQSGNRTAHNLTPYPTKPPLIRSEAVLLCLCNRFHVTTAITAVVFIVSAAS